MKNQPIIDRLFPKIDRFNAPFLLPIYYPNAGICYRPSSAQQMSNRPVIVRFGPFSL